MLFVLSLTKDMAAMQAARDKVQWYTQKEQDWQDTMNKVQQQLSGFTQRQAALKQQAEEVSLCKSAMSIA